MMSAENLARFRDRMGGVLVRDLQLDPGLSYDVASAASEMLARDGAGSFEAIRTLLSRYGIAEQWQHLVCHERARVIAEWIAPYTRGTVMDLFCEGAELGELLWEQGSLVVLAERESASLDRAPRAEVSVYRVGAREGGLPACDTALLCDLLHREEEPGALLSRAAAAGASRLILIESVVEPECPGELARLVDLFVHRCVKTSESASLRAPGRHRTVESWLAPDVCPWRVAAVERKEALPGIPLPHALIVADVAAGGRGLGRQRRCLSRPEDDCAA